MTQTAITVDTNVLDYISGGADLEAILTTDHPASSYGLPVVIRDGIVVGPAECPAIMWAETVDLVDAARRAGYTFAPSFAVGDTRVY